MSFAAINLKFLIMINNYTSYDRQIFGAIYATYELGELRKSKSSIILSFFFLLY